MQVFREFFPTKDEYVTLECVWESDKFVLLERTHKSEISSHDGDLEENFSIQAASVQYQRLNSFLGGKIVHVMCFFVSYVGSSPHLHWFLIL